MKQFLVKYVDASGKYQRETIQAQSVQDCERMVRSRNGTFVAAEVSALQGKDRSQALKLEDLLEFASVISSLLSASLSIRDALAMVGTISKRERVTSLVNRLAACIDKGESLSAAVARETTSFPPIITALISIGEKTGNLAKSFERIVQYTERRHKLESSLRSALGYPVMVLVLLVVGSIAVGIYAFPKFNELFSAMGGEAARELQRALANARVSTIVASIILAGSVITGITLTVASKKNIKTKRNLDKVLLGLPVIGKYLVELNTLDFVFSMEALVSSGITVNDALSESMKSIGNSEYAAMVETAKLAINKGLPLSAAFESDKRFPAQLAMWIKVGERSGNVSSVFGHMRAYYEEEVNKRIARFVRLIEPAMNVLIGIIMLFVIFTVIIPFFNAYGSMLQ